MKRIFNKIDATFEQLLNVVSQNLTREQTRNLLKEFHLQELPDVDEIRADLFSRPNIVPTNVIYVLYLPTDKAVKSDINIGYPKYIPKIIAETHRRQMLRKLDKFLNERFGPAKSFANGIYWKSLSTLVIRNLKETGKGPVKGALYIGIEVFDTNIFPTEKALEKIKNGRI